MKSKLIIATVALFLLARVHAGNNQAYPEWRVQFEAIAQSAGLTSGDACTRYANGQETHPERLFDYYQAGRTPQEAFEEIGCDAEVFQSVWIPRLRYLAEKQYTAMIPEDNEAFEEWLWLEHFTEGKSPEEAIKAMDRRGYLRP